MTKPDFVKTEPILCNFLLLAKNLDQQLKNTQKLGQSWQNLVLPFNFFWNFALETTIRISQSSEVWDWQISVLDETRSQIDNTVYTLSTLCSRYQQFAVSSVLIFSSQQPQAKGELFEQPPICVSLARARTSAYKWTKKTFLEVTVFDMKLFHDPDWNFN
jgi:hypothetical protein